MIRRPGVLSFIIIGVIIIIVLIVVIIMIGIIIVIIVIIALCYKVLELMSSNLMCIASKNLHSANKQCNDT